MEAVEMSCKPPTLEGFLSENNILICECLEITGLILNQLIAVGDSKQIAENKPDCVMADVTMQNQNLQQLKSRLLDIKTTIIN